MDKSSKNLTNSGPNSETETVEISNKDIHDGELSGEHTDTNDASLLKRENAVTQKENELAKAKEQLSKKEAEIVQKMLEIEEKELQAKNGFPKLLEERFAPFRDQLEERERKLENEFRKIEQIKASLSDRERELKKAEVERENGYQDSLKTFEASLEERRIRLEDDLSKLRIQKFEKINQEMNKERETRLSLLESELANQRIELQQEIDNFKNEINTKIQELNSREQAVENLEFEKQKAIRLQERLNEEIGLLSEKIEDGIADERRTFNSGIQAKDNEIIKLRESIETSTNLISNFEELKRKLGDEDPAVVLLKLKTYEEEIRNLRLELASRPTKEMQQAFDRINEAKDVLEKSCERLSEENWSLRNASRSQAELEYQIEETKIHNKSLQQRIDSVDAENNRLMAELKRLQSAYEREEDREARIRDIESPLIEIDYPRETNKVDEIEWLDRIGKSCIDYGLSFPRRILYAFHTALKTAEWSPVTVLAGVSGTGKSELPRLYSHFGGMNFLSLSVQPNWDSQESMLGFFNSIDNKFDAQPVLRLLAQSQKMKDESYPFGLLDVMTLILMDEMNLSHVELYFAEFLSKLELRRGCKGNDVPNLAVKLGAGIEHYNLPLGRNVLWAGTMNQDETTKSLSDKVLDRGIVINFPRPTTLERRKELKPLGDQTPLLSRKLWESWWCRKSIFEDDQILPYKGFIETMNTSLSKVGRALGHRVWQSIEYYMSNYPEVMLAQKNNDDRLLAKAMKTAFEDQLVQKVMPKLRGIETRGVSKSQCLDMIRSQLVEDDYAIIEDFDLACEFGYGQFIWNSANYIKDSGTDHMGELGIEANGQETEN